MKGEQKKMKTVTVVCKSKGNWEMECARLSKIERITLIGCLEHARLELAREVIEDEKYMILYTTTYETLKKLRTAWKLDEQEDEE